MMVHNTHRREWNNMCVVFHLFSNRQFLLKFLVVFHFSYSFWFIHFDTEIKWTREQDVVVNIRHLDWFTCRWQTIHWVFVSVVEVRSMSLPINTDATPPFVSTLQFPLFSSARIEHNMKRYGERGYSLVSTLSHYKKIPQGSHLWL